MRKRTAISLRFKNEAFIISERYCNQLFFLFLNSMLSGYQGHIGKICECQSMFIIAMRISIFQSLLFENEAYNIFLAFCYPCSWKFLSFSHDLTLPIVGSTFQLTGRHDLIGLSRSVEIFAASQAVRLPAVELTSFLNFTTRHPVSRVVNSN